MTPLDQKITRLFAGLVVRKDLTKAVKGNAIVPSYVLEYLLGQHCATDDVASIESGIESVKAILAKHFVHRSESELIKSTIKEKGRHKIIDKVVVELNDKEGVYEGAFSNLGLRRVAVDPAYIKKHPKLLVGGVWCIADLSYQPGENPKDEPWHLESLKPIQIAHVDMDQLLRTRREFGTSEWMDVLLQSMGFNPEMFSRRGKLLLLTRLIPYCERNYNLVELGPKGTGKSHIYAEFSPHGILISGGEVTAAKLFVNNSSGKIGLVGYWDCICFDEFAGKDKKVDKNLIDIMKNFMANKTFSRGIEMLGGEASMVFMGNTRKSVPYMMKHSHFFEELPDKYIDSAFLDRIHAYNPGWECSTVRAEVFTQGFGFIVDFLAEVLRHLRVQDYSHLYQTHFELNSELTNRDRDGVHKTFSGLMKILFPDGAASKEEMEEILALAMEDRRRVREQLLKIDETFSAVTFSYLDRGSGETREVVTLEERQHPALARDGARRTVEEDTLNGDSGAGCDPRSDEPSSARQAPQPGHVVIPENSKGWSYRRIFEAHLTGAKKITVSDPYVRLFFQARNVMELLQMVHELVPEGDEVSVHLVTQSDPDSCVRQTENLDQIVNAFTGTRVSFTWELNHSPGFHARSIVTDSGWKITIDRGLDLFQKFDFGPFSLEQYMQEARLTRGAEITYLRL